MRAPERSGGGGGGTPEGPYGRHGKAPPESLLNRTEIGKSVL